MYDKIKVETDRTSRIAVVEKALFLLGSKLDEVRDSAIEGACSFAPRLDAVERSQSIFEERHTTRLEKLAESFNHLTVPTLAKNEHLL